jgi:hypothetical protein
MERLERELNSGRQSLAVYVAGNGRTPEARAKLHEAFGDTYAVHAFRHIQHIALTDTLLVVARLTDFAGKDRHCLPLLKARLHEDKQVIASAALDWPGGREADGSPTRTGIEYREMVEKELPVLNSDISTFLKSPGVEEIRSMRDAALAHALDLDHLPVTSESIELGFHEADRIVAKASLLITEKHWDPDQFNEGPELYANDLWDAVEAGLPKTKLVDKRNMPRP